MRCKSRSRKRDWIDRKTHDLTNGEKNLPVCAGRKHDFLGGGVEGDEKFLDQTRFDSASFAGRNNVADDRIQPGVFADAKDDARSLVHFQFIDRSFRKQIAKNFDAFHHFLAQFCLGNLLHRLGNEFEIALVSNIKFDLVPNIREKRPRIVVNELVEHFFIREFDEAAARMVGGKILAAEFPKRGVEITNVDHVAGSVADFDAVADAIRPP
jgi:hypothetical protein